MPRLPRYWVLPAVIGFVFLAGALPARPRSDAEDSSSAQIPEDTGDAAVTPYGKIDTTPPVISSIAVSDVGADTATIMWTTDEVSDSIVRYGAAPNTDSTVTKTTYVLTHSVTLTGLNPGTGYSFCIDAHDKAQNLAESCGNVFSTDTPFTPDVTPPVISGMQILDVATSTAIVTWATDEIATGQVEYGITDAYGEQTIPTETLDTLHSVMLQGLASQTTYHVRVDSSDSAGNVATSSDISFTTASSSGSMDSTPPGPLLSGIRAHDATQSSARVAWDTDVPADSQIRYGSDTGYGETTALDTSLVLVHDVLIGGLAANTSYHALVESRDADGHISTSEDFTFQTAPVGTGIGGSATTTPPIVGIPPETTASSSGSASGLSQNGQGTHGALASLLPRKVKDVAAYGLDHTVIVTWNTDPLDKNATGASIVRSDTAYPSNPQDGTLVYDGSGNIFSDINLTNNKTYYYSLFAQSQAHANAASVQLSVAPTADPKSYSVTHADLGKVSILSTNDFGPGSSGTVVSYLQRLLATDPALYPQGLVTGYFGPLTEDALLRFQKTNDIPQTGIVDANVRAVAQNLNLPQQVNETNGIRSDMRLGSSGENVEVLQIALVQLGYLQHDSITGYYGASTTAAVAAFQRDNGITPSAGYFGPITRQQIFLKTSSATSTGE